MSALDGVEGNSLDSVQAFRDMSENQYAGWRLRKE